LQLGLGQAFCKLSSDELDTLDSALKLTGLNLSLSVRGLIKEYITAIEARRYAFERECLADSKIKYTYKQILQKTRHTTKRREQVQMLQAAPARRMQRSTSS
jgi:hypothetical protein